MARRRATPNEGTSAANADWLPLGTDDPLLSPPATLAPTLVDPAPALLPTHELPWEDFERLTVQMARELDDAHDVRLFGTRGQAQQGIDVVGFFGDGHGPAVYQAKRQQAFSARDLERAVNRYLGGQRPFDAKRIVVVVATESRDTATIQKLADLRDANPKLTIELWDRSAISDRLRREPDCREVLWPGDRNALLRLHHYCSAPARWTDLGGCRPTRPGCAPRDAREPT